MSLFFFIFLSFSEMFCDSYTLNIFFISGGDETSFFYTFILSNAEYDLRYYVIYNATKIFFQAHVLLETVILVRTYTKKITEKKKSC